MTLKIRPAEENDCTTILDLIFELARFEKLEHEVVADVASLRRHLFGDTRRAEAIVAEKDGSTIGFALFFHNFSTFLGRPGLYLEDLYVRSEHRGLGAGMAMLSRLAQIARERGCGRMEWSVLNWNAKAIALYESLGARPQSEWAVYRLTPEMIDKLAERTRSEP